MNDKQIEERNDMFDSAVREQLAGYEPIVPHALWNRISSELDREEPASQATTIIPHYTGGNGKWKMAIAAAVLLTLTVGTLLYKMDMQPDVKIASAPAVKKAATTAAKQTEAITPAQATETKMVAQSSATPMHKAIAATHNKADKKPVTPEPIQAAAVQTTPVNTPATQEQTAQDLEFTTVPTENKPVEVGNIPLASLNFLSTPSTVNDEITVIKSTEKKKKHARKSEDESTKVIMLGKRFDSKPDIKYQVPVRF
jgi:hypothetical protein